MPGCDAVGLTTLYAPQEALVVMPDRLRRSILFVLRNCSSCIGVIKASPKASEPSSKTSPKSDRCNLSAASRVIDAGIYG